MFDDIIKKKEKPSFDKVIVAMCISMLGKDQRKCMDYVEHNGHCRHQSEIQITDIDGIIKWSVNCEFRT